jgi:hypothetical protein
MHGFQTRLLRLFLVVSVCISISACAGESPKDDATKPAAAAGVRQLRPLLHKGRPFFPIGAYNPPRPESGQGFVPLSLVRKQGWNTIHTHVFDDIQETKRYLDEAEAEGLAVILSLHNLVSAQKQGEVVRIAEVVRNHPALLGYYIFDEPENVFSNSQEYKRIGLGGYSVGLEDLNQFITRKIGWVQPLIRKTDPNPEHYTFMCIAWWNCYRKLQPLCEINMPNEYPTRGTGKEFEGPHANIVYDAKMAAEAARQAGGQGFCYTPFAVNIGVEGYRYPTVNEFRYSVFAPITQGAMGIIYWAGYRCKAPYTEQVVFPVTRELDGLKSFFLGKWLDEKLSCQPTQRSTELLKKYDLPAVSGCLRRNDDGRYLLLAVNNTADAVQAVFRLDVEKLPADGMEFISGRKVAIDNGVIKDRMQPYGVCAYVIEPAKNTSD